MKTSETGLGREGNTHPKRLSFPLSEQDSPRPFAHRPQTPQRSFQGGVAGSIHATPSPKRAHSGSHGETRGVSDGGRYYYPRSVSHVSETLRGRVSERRTLPLWGLGRVYSRRTQRAFGTAMCLYASLFRGAAAPLGCVILSLVFQHCVLLLSMWNSHTTQTDWYHHSRLVLHAVEPPTSGHQNGPLVVCCSVGKFFIDFSSV